MRRTQEAHVMPVTGNVTSVPSADVKSVVAMVKLLARELEQLAQLADHLRVAAFLEAGWHARGQVSFQQRTLEGLDRALDRVRLLEDVDAVNVVLDHLADTAQMTLDGRQAVHDLFLVSLHAASPGPQGEGVQVRYNDCSAAVSTPSQVGWVRTSICWRAHREHQ